MSKYKCQHPLFIAVSRPKEEGKWNTTILKTETTKEGIKSPEKQFLEKRKESNFMKKRYYMVPCGKCPCCLKNKANEWNLRLQAEMIRGKISATGTGLELEKYYDHIYMGLITYRDEAMPTKWNSKTKKYEPVLNKKDLQLLFKRLRKKGYQFSYFLKGEYGEKKGRPHYHIILMMHGEGFELDGTKGSYTRKKHYTYQCKELEKIWKKGICRVAEITHTDSKAINYCCGYVIKKCIEKDHLVKEFILTSKNKGIGLSYLETYKNQIISYNKENNNIFNFNGHPRKIPQYFKRVIKNKDPDLYEFTILNNLVRLRDDENLEKRIIEDDEYGKVMGEKIKQEIFDKYKDGDEWEDELYKNTKRTSDERTWV